MRITVRKLLSGDQAVVKYHFNRKIVSIGIGDYKSSLFFIPYSLFLIPLARHNQTGILGEKMAAEYLLEKGFTILHQNWRYSHWEVDFIASLNNTLHFIEVKTRRTRKFGYPEEDVTKKKMENLINASEEFIYLYPEWKRIQFDILSISIPANTSPEFFFIEDVYINK